MGLRSFNPTPATQGLDRLQSSVDSVQISLFLKLEWKAGRDTHLFPEQNPQLFPCSNTVHIR
jgi:hypothetical protein